MTYFKATKLAESESKKHGCTQHVNVIIEHKHDEIEPTIAGYYVSDWLDGSTVATFG